MLHLLIVSLLWAFSFGLIKGNLTGIDSNFVSFARMGISLLIFLPFFKYKNLDVKLSSKLVLTGALQYGVMYLSYIYSFQFLKAYEVALFTIFTPLYISIINDLLNKKFNKLYFLKSIIAIIGAGIITYKGSESANLIKGFFILQISNIAFGFGQIYYKRLLENSQIKDVNIFALLYAGATIITALFSGFTTDFSNLSISFEQTYTIVYLGVIASGLGFFLWNYGARKTDAGTLAVFNNLKIPLAMLVSFIFFGESVSIEKLIAGGIVITIALLIGNKLTLGKNNSE